MIGCTVATPYFFHGVSYVFIVFEIIEDFFEYGAIQVLFDKNINFGSCERPMFKNDPFYLVMNSIFNYFTVFFISEDFYRQLLFCEVLPHYLSAISL